MMDDRSLEGGGRSIRRISPEIEEEQGYPVRENGRSSSRFVSKDTNRRDGSLSIRARIESTRAASHARIVALKVRWELVGWYCGGDLVVVVVIVSRII